MARQVEKSGLPVPIVGWKKRNGGLLLRLVIFRLVDPPLQPGVVGLYPVWVYGFLAICRWREPVISRILDHNR
jgi:hypothetical protein